MIIVEKSINDSDYTFINIIDNNSIILKNDELEFLNNNQLILKININTSTLSDITDYNINEFSINLIKLPFYLKFKEEYDSKLIETDTFKYDGIESTVIINECHIQIDNINNTCEFELTQNNQLCHLVYGSFINCLFIPLNVFFKYLYNWEKISNYIR